MLFRSHADFEIRSAVERDSDVRKVARAEEDMAMSAHSPSPLRTSSEPPPQISWTHVWGTVKWGKRAGAWGKGVEGLEERREKEPTSVEKGRERR